ncbi:MAG: SDR family oxidoreductase [Nevskiales bacterium]|nr:SDR family oxidoreductase [Nevskiales bacterium]
MSILITGATGFIGRHLCAGLTAQGHEVMVLMRSPQRFPILRQAVDRLGGSAERLTMVAGDLDRPDLDLRSPLPRLRSIVHLGARFGWRLDPDAARKTNVEGSRAVLELAARQGARLVYVSGFMLDNRAHLQRLGLDPDDVERCDWRRAYRHAGAYEASKLEGALRVRAWARALGVEYVEVLPATVAGHSITGELDPAQPLWNLIDNLASGRLSMVPGSPQHWLPLVAVDHLAAVLGLAATVDDVPGRLLLRDAATPNLQPMLAALARALGVTAPKRHLPIGVMSAILRVPGVARLMRSEPEALHFIQAYRPDGEAADRFAELHGLSHPPIDTVLMAMVRRYRAGALESDGLLHRQQAV